jgi:hypothetical protein
MILSLFRELSKGLIHVKAAMRNGRPGFPVRPSSWDCAGTVAQMSVAVNIKPLAEAATMTGST